jgi:hypothetical protein
MLGRVSRSGGVARGDPRARRTPPEGALSSRRTSPEGALSPRARRTSPEGSFSLGSLVGRGGHQGCDRGVCVLASWVSLRFPFFTKLGGFSPVV